MWLCVLDSTASSGGKLEKYWKWKHLKRSKISSLTSRLPAKLRRCSEIPLSDITCFEAQIAAIIGCTGCRGNCCLLVTLHVRDVKCVWNILKLISKHYFDVCTWVLYWCVGLTLVLCVASTLIYYSVYSATLKMEATYSSETWMTFNPNTPEDSIVQLVLLWSAYF
jgi:hypothetical protein